MSIFQSNFSEHIKKQLEVRRNPMFFARTPQELAYMNSRNSWVRLSSSVNVKGSNLLAEQYQLGPVKLLGLGTRDNIDNPNKENIPWDAFASSNLSRTKTPYSRGIRPFPGITGVDIKSKSAYGSLREAIVNFVCWDIQQLEDLELLYMRPGYTVLLEWGWTPYILSTPEGDTKYCPTFEDFYDIINPSTKDRRTIFRELYEKTLKYEGNYDAIFGYIKNYQWSARMDGGYDCQTTIITTGEIVESLKVNYILPSLSIFGEKEGGLLTPEFSGQGTISQWIEDYKTKPSLAAMWKECYCKLIDFPQTELYTNGILNEKNTFTVPDISLIDPNDTRDTLVTNNTAVYITLEAACRLITKYIIAISKSDDRPLIYLSTRASGLTSDGSPLLCVAHPLQVSVDPSICVIKSPLWSDNEQSIITTVQDVAALTPDEEKNLREAYDAIQQGISGVNLTTIGEDSTIEGLKKITNNKIYREINTLIKNDGKYNDLSDLLNNNVGGRGDFDFADRIVGALTESNPDLSVTKSASSGPLGFFAQFTFVITERGENTAPSTININQQSQQALTNIEFLNKIPLDFFYNADPYLELGYIGNIYINLDFLYKQALNIGGLENVDPKEKNEINVYDYIKSIISAVQSSIGNINNFEIHVDPIDNNVARIIDVKYTEPNKNKNLYELPIHSLGSIVRSYSLQSQIFPEQSTMIAVGSQAKGGQLGIQANTFIDFNNNLTDRIILEKVDPVDSDIKVTDNFTPTVINGLIKIIELFGSLNINNSTQTSIQSLSSNAKNALRDVISYFQSITKSPGSNRSLIPAKFSCEMDGIGGMIIGNMFKLPEEVLPKGYRGNDEVGVDLGNAITSISHTIGGGDWVTKLETLYVILEDISNNVDFKKLDLSTIVDIIKSLGSVGGKAPLNQNAIDNFGKVDNSIPDWGRALLDMISYFEGTARAGQNGYDITFNFRIISGWTPDTTQGHPNLVFPFGNSTTRAAGRYQFQYDTWTGINNNSNAAFNKVNQDKGGFTLIKKRLKSAQDGEKAYELAKSGITNVTENSYFLNILGNGKTNLAGEWASIPDRNGTYPYAGQGDRDKGTQDIYNIYLKAVETYSGNKVSSTSTTTPPTSPPSNSSPSSKKVIVIGDSQVPFIMKYAPKNAVIGKGLQQAKKDLNWLKKAVSSTSEDSSVTSVIIVIGTNGNFNPKDDVNGLVDLLYKKFPNANLAVVGGSWGWGNNKGANEEQLASAYYSKFVNKGVTFFGYIGETDDPHKDLPIYKYIGEDINLFANKNIAPLHLLTP